MYWNIVLRKTRTLSEKNRESNANRKRKTFFQFNFVNLKKQKSYCDLRYNFSFYRQVTLIIIKLKIRYWKANILIIFGKRDRFRPYVLQNLLFLRGDFPQDFSSIGRWRGQFTGREKLEDGVGYLDNQRGETPITN